MKRPWSTVLFAAIAGGAIFSLAARCRAADYNIYVSNERSGQVTIIRGSDHKLVATIPVGSGPAACK